MWEKLNIQGGGSTPILDDLTSTSTTSALSANQGKVLNDKITPLEKGQLTVNTVNLFDKTKIDPNGFWYVSGATIAFANSGSTRSSDYIEVTEGLKYAGKNTGIVLYYDVNKNYISNQTTANEWAVPTGTGIKFMRINISTANLDSAMVIKGTKNAIPYNYVPYQQPVSVIDPSFKKWLAMGDSITFGQNLSVSDYATKSYTAIANKRLKMDLRNIGYPGAKMSYIAADGLRVYSFIELSKGLYNTLPLDFNDYDVLTVAYGTNDYGYNSGTGVPIGTIDSVDETTFYGAMNVGIQNILSGKSTSNPKIKIIFILPIFRTNADTANPPRNSNGHSLQDYRDAIIAVCKKWKIPFIDAYNGLGMNSLNESVFMDDGLHPIEAGHKRYGEFLAGQMFSLGII